MLLDVIRSQTSDLVCLLDTLNVPFLVFSAGLGDVVNAILKHHGVNYKNIHVISNFLKYEGDQVNGFVSDIIHPFNKNGKGAEHSKYFEVMLKKIKSYQLHV